MPIRIFLLAFVFAAFSQAEEMSKKQKTGYTIGYQMGSGLEVVRDDIDLDALISGIKAAVAGEDAVLEQAEMQKLTMELRTTMRAKMQAEQEKAASENLEAGKAFLEENAKKEGWSSTPSGLQYRVIQAGEGDKPSATSSVTVNYRGTLIDGTEFDSSYKRDQPASFGLNRVIKGWTEGLQLMSPGAKYEFAIHPDLGYGPGAKPSIPPNSVLIFEVELLSIN